MTYALQNICVLVVDDNKPLLEITKSLLAIFGIGKIIGTTNPQKAIDLIREYKPDIVVTDWSMEPLDGIELTKFIRTSELSPDPFLPVIMMSGHSSIDRVMRARDAGINEFLAKPYTAKNLYKRIFRIIEKPRQFVCTDDFFGPDRRHQEHDCEYEGPKRRQRDDFYVDVPREERQTEHRTH